VGYGWGGGMYGVRMGFSVINVFGNIKYIASSKLLSQEFLKNRLNLAFFF
jgi:hypothetical protein